MLEFFVLVRTYFKKTAATTKLIMDVASLNDRRTITEIHDLKEIPTVVV